MITAFGNTKGGVGKSTLALNMAIEFTRRGSKVYLVDSDQQKNAEDAISIRMESGIKPGIRCASFNDSKKLINQLKLEREQCDQIIIDLGGYNGEILRSVLVFADNLIIPVRPSDFDIWALQSMKSLIEEAQPIRESLDKSPLSVHALINCATYWDSKLNRDTEATLKKCAWLNHIPKKICNRKAFTTSVTSGQSICEWGKDKKATEEFNQLYHFVQKLQPNEG